MTEKKRVTKTFHDPLKRKKYLDGAKKRLSGMLKKKGSKSTISVADDFDIAIVEDTKSGEHETILVIDDIVNQSCVAYFLNPDSVMSLTESLMHSALDAHLSTCDNCPEAMEAQREVQEEESSPKTIPKILLN